MTKKVAFFTLGCKTNQYESEAMASLFRKRGYETVDFYEKADVYVINTCTVTNMGDRKSRQIIRRAVKNNPEAIVAVTGCYAQMFPSEVLDIKGVNLVIGTLDKSKIVDLVEEALKSPVPLNAVKEVMSNREFEELSITDYQTRTRAFVKIQEGCSNFCSYCIIPYARGPVRSRHPEKVLSEVKRLIEEGFKEIVLTGIHIGAYGRDFRDRKTDLADLVIKIALLPGLARLRLGSVEPLDITPRLIKAMAEIKTICRHLHIPLQSGDDYILKRMRRNYNNIEYSRLISAIKEQIPEAGITTDIIVGFPGEKQENFENTYKMVEKIGFSKTHVFKYSPRKGTPAADFPEQVPARVKEERSRKLIALDMKNQKKFAQRFIGKRLEVLIEQKVNGSAELWEGLTENYLRVMVESSKYLKGELIDVIPHTVHETCLVAKIKD